MTWAVEKRSEFDTHRERLDALEVFSVVCVAMGVGLRSLWMGKRELWYDEVLSVLMASGQKSAYKTAGRCAFFATNVFWVVRYFSDAAHCGFC